MAFLAFLALCLATLSGCVGQVVNTAQLYPPVSGVIGMDIRVPSGESLAKVQFMADDKLISEDSDASNGFSAELDTSDYASDSLVKIKVVGVRADNSTLTLRENFILIGKQEEAEATAAVEDATDTEDVATDDESNEEASTATDAE